MIVDRRRAARYSRVHSEQVVAARADGCSRDRAAVAGIWSRTAERARAAKPPSTGTPAATRSARRPRVPGGGEGPLLHHILRVAHAAEHPIGDGERRRAQLVELLLGHRFSRVPSTILRDAQLMRVAQPSGRIDETGFSRRGAGEPRHRFKRFDASPSERTRYVATCLLGLLDPERRGKAVALCRARIGDESTATRSLRPALASSGPSYFSTHADAGSVSFLTKGRTKEHAISWCGAPGSTLFRDR